jgi:hypothetical protein
LKCGLRCTCAFPLGVSLHIGAGVSFDFFGLLSPWGILMLHTCVFYINFSSRTCLLLSTCGFLCSWRLLFIGRLLFIYCVRLLDFSNNPGDLTSSLLFIVVSIVNPGGGDAAGEVAASAVWLAKLLKLRRHYLNQIPTIPNPTKQHNSNTTNTVVDTNPSQWMLGSR